MSDSPNDPTPDPTPEVIRPEVVDQYREFQYEQSPAAYDTGAAACLILAIASYAVLPFICAIPVVFLAPSAKRRIRRSNGALQGLGMARAAQWLAWLNIFICIALVYLVFWIFNVAFSTHNLGLS